MSKEIIGELFEEQYIQFKKYLKNHYRSLNEYDVEDIIQQTIMKLLYKDEDITRITNIKSYIFSSLSNGAKDYFKKHNRVEIHEEFSKHFINQITSSTEDIVLQNELMEITQNVLNKMDANLRFAYIETKLKGRSYKDIMKETNEKLGTLLSRKNRAKKKIKDAINNYNQYKE